MKALADQMDVVRKAYEKECNEALVTFEKAYQEVVDNEKSLQALMEQQKNEAIELSKIEVEFRPARRAPPSRTTRCTASSPRVRRRSTSRVR